MERITERDLEGQVKRLNAAEFGQWQDQWPVYYRDAAGIFHQVAGVYHLSHAYGGVALERTCDLNEAHESHGVSDVFGWHMPKRELYEKLAAFTSGIEHGRELSESGFVRVETIAVMFLLSGFAYLTVHALVWAWQLAGAVRPALGGGA